MGIVKAILLRVHGLRRGARRLLHDGLVLEHEPVVVALGEDVDVVRGAVVLFSPHSSAHHAQHAQQLAYSSGVTANATAVYSAWHVQKTASVLRVPTANVSPGANTCRHTRSANWCSA